MMTRRHSRGYALTELLVVLAMIGVITLVSVPALMQLMPQYRMRSAASEIAATLRMVRQDALATRRPWKVSFDASNEQYSIWRLSSPTADVKQAANWDKIGLDNRPESGSNIAWKRLSAKEMDLQTSTANAFHDVDCANGVDIIFKRDGTVDTSYNTGCTAGATAALAFTTTPTIRLYYNSNFLAYNRYDIGVLQTGDVTITPSKG